MSHVPREWVMSHMNVSCPICITHEICSLQKEIQKIEPSKTCTRTHTRIHIYWYTHTHIHSHTQTHTHAQVNGGGNNWNVKLCDYQKKGWCRCVPTLVSPLYFPHFPPSLLPLNPFPLYHTCLIAHMVWLPWLLASSDRWWRGNVLLIKCIYIYTIKEGTYTW